MSETVFYDIPYRKRGRPSKRPDSKTLSDLYSKYSVEEIAEKYGVSRTTVYVWAAEARKEYREYVNK